MPEVWFPGSDKPFRPLNPYGRPMPKGKRTGRPQLHQVCAWVKQPDGAWKETRLGPKMEKQFCDAFYETICKSIKVGADAEIRNPYVVAVKSEHEAQGQKTLRDLIMEKV